MLVEDVHRVSANDVARGTFAVLDNAGNMVNVRAQVVHLPQHYGGTRAMVLCPDCGRRCKFLYIVSGRATCRVCGRLMYRSQFQDADTRLMNRALKLQLRLGDPCWTHMPKRPKGMHHTTYERLCWELYDLKERWSGRVWG